MNDALVREYPMKYLGGQLVSVAGTATIPSQANAFSISAETADIYYTINSPIASTSSPGFCPQDGYRFEGPIGNLSQLAIFPASGGIAHIEFFKM